MAVLVVQQPGGARLVTFNGHVTVGRDQASGVVIDHPTVSRHHAQIESDAAGYYVVDPGSTNGTRVNGRLVKGRAAIADATRVRFGRVVCHFYVKELPPDQAIALGPTVDPGVAVRCECGRRLWMLDKGPEETECPGCHRAVSKKQRAADSGETVSGAAVAQGVICAICQWPVDKADEKTLCPHCGTTSHTDCWTHNGGCGTYGCEAAAHATKETVADAEAESAPSDGPTAEVDTGLAPDPGADAIHAAPRESDAAHLAGVVIATLLGLLLFGVPAAVAGAICFKHRRWRAAACSLIGITAGVAASMKHWILP